MKILPGRNLSNVTPLFGLNFAFPHVAMSDWIFAISMKIVMILSVF